MEALTDKKYELYDGGPIVYKIDGLKGGWITVDEYELLKEISESERKRDAEAFMFGRTPTEEQIKDHIKWYNRNTILKKNAFKKR